MASKTVVARIARSHRRRAEERVVCAILHASCPFGLLAIAASAVVWATQRSRTRFLSIQSLQALLFQLVAFLSPIPLFGVLVVGVNVAMVLEWFAPPRAISPQLSMFLTGAMVVAVVTVFFTRFLFPLWGAWAAIRILRGRNHRYPILGRLAINWSSRWPTTTAEASSDWELDPESASNETILAGLAHLSALGVLSPVLVPILWATAKRRSRFLVNHLLQAALFQLAVIACGSALVAIFWPVMILLQLSNLYLPSRRISPNPLILSPFFQLGCMGIFVLSALTVALLAIVAAIKAFRGQEYHYPVVGEWLKRYLDTESDLTG